MTLYISTIRDPWKQEPLAVPVTFKTQDEIFWPKARLVKVNWEAGKRK